ncbi:acyl-CoA carboxylase subunit epsilon [Janibacter sp. GXQ6167]|uniref:acyl-CoA carboxylase subunit epsilon n=1 Tax=Janibacter sp. GXQ6167 TaxID=3240791 RepID=UPI0035264ACD
MSADQQPESAEAPAPAGPVISVLGDASEEQLAALLAVLSGLGGGEEPAPSARSQWGHPQRAMRTTFPVGPGGWRLSGLPR